MKAEQGMDDITAAVLTGPMSIELARFPRPAIDADTAVLEVAANGICGSDVAWRRGAAAAPHILGHEVVGRIAEIGERAATRWGVNTGDLVAVEASIHCGACRGCLSGEGCTSARNYGANIGIDVPPSLWGGLAQAMYLDEGTVVTRLTDDLDPAVAAGWFSPLANAVDWVGDVGAAAQPGDVVVILGPGPQGLAGCVVAKARGAQVILVGLARDGARLEAGRSLGADHVVVADEVHVSDAVRELTDGRLADAILDVSGHAPSAALAPLLVRRGGAVAAASPVELGTNVELPVAHMVLNEIRWRGLRSNRPAAAAAAAVLLNRNVAALEPLVTHRFALDRAGEAIDVVAAGGDGARAAIKVVVCP